MPKTVQDILVDTFLGKTFIDLSGSKRNGQLYTILVLAPVSRAKGGKRESFTIEYEDGYNTQVSLNYMTHDVLVEESEKTPQKA